MPCRLDLPFTAFGRSMRARNALLDHFQQAVTAARSKLAAGQQVPGIIGSLTAAVDEEGNRWVGFSSVCTAMGAHFSVA